MRFCLKGIDGSESKCYELRVFLVEFRSRFFGADSMELYQTDKAQLGGSGGELKRITSSFAP